MKKSKLLIPALAIASVGCTVAPIVTSCNGTKSSGTTTIAMTEVVAVIGKGYSSGTTLFNVAANQTIKYTGINASNMAYLGITTPSTNPIKLNLGISSVKVNGVACEQESELYKIPSSVTTVTYVEVTYSEAGGNCTAAIAFTPAE